jgi:hypothetical protein
LQRLFLHARSLRLTLPEQGVLELVAPLDIELENILDKIRK